MVNLKIRRFRAEDAARVSYVIRKCLFGVNLDDYSMDVMLLKSREASPANIRKMAASRYFVVGLSGKQIVACATWSGKIIRTLFVNPRFHRMGIGTAMMRYLEGRAKSAGIKEVEVPASVTAYRLKFYDKLGYTKVRHFMEDEVVPAVLMKKRL